MLLRSWLGSSLLLATVDALTLLPSARVKAQPRCAQVRLAEEISFLLQELPPAKAGILILTWSKAAQHVRADGFKPNIEAIGERAPQMKVIEKLLPGLASKANILALCAKGSMSFDTLQEPHASVAMRLSRTKVYGALSAGGGSAVGFVSSWPDHVSIDGCAINPSFLAAGEDAERALLEWQVAEALANGVTDIRLTPSGVQLDDEAFYAACGFHPVEGSEQLSYQAAARSEGAPAPESADAPAPEPSEPEGVPAAAEPAEDLGPAPPAGFEWGGTF